MLMTLKRRVMDPRAADDITDALKVAAFARVTPKADETPEAFQRRLADLHAAPLGYLSNYYPEGLRHRVLGPHAKELVGISRYYPTLTPPVAIDFEPAPPDPWYLDAKRQFFFEKGVVFIPIHLQDQLTPEAFAERYKEAVGVATSKDQQAAAGVAEAVAEAAHAPEVEDILQQADFIAAITACATRRADAHIASTGKRLVGVVRKNLITQQTREIVADLRRHLRRGMDRERCYQQLTDEIKRSGDGQKRPPVASRSGA